MWSIEVGEVRGMKLKGMASGFSGDSADCGGKESRGRIPDTALCESSGKVSKGRVSGTAVCESPDCAHDCAIDCEVNPSKIRSLAA